MRFSKQLVATLDTRTLLSSVNEGTYWLASLHIKASCTDAT